MWSDYDLHIYLLWVVLKLSLMDKEMHLRSNFLKQKSMLFLLRQQIHTWNWCIWLIFTHSNYLTKLKIIIIIKNNSIAIYIFINKLFFYYIFIDFNLLEICWDHDSMIILGLLGLINEPFLIIFLSINLPRTLDLNYPKFTTFLGV